MSQVQSLSFSVQNQNPLFSTATIIVPASYIAILYNEASNTQKSNIQTIGFSKGETPLSYIQKNFQPNLIEHIKEFCLKYFVLSWFYQELYTKKILIAGEPNLESITVTPTNDLAFNFSFTLAQPIILHGWKRLPFKAPKRKNYKDLDRQVEQFLQEEENAKKTVTDNLICIGDWINFTVSIVDKHGKPLFEDHKENLWVKIGSEEADAPFQSLFLTKKIGDSFITTSECLQEYFSSHLDTHYTFLVEIIEVLHAAYFCIEHFKRHFRIKSTKEIHQKLIEVFSYRNDISQRRAIAEETLKLLVTRHPFSIPAHLVLRQKQIILDIISRSPDYQVYKMQSDFHQKIKLLAERQVRENIFVHQLGMHEEVEINNHDIKAYLNLSNRPRTTEFIYFEPPTTKFAGHEVPISTTLLTLSCLKEKTLNHAISNLMKNKDL